MSPHHTRHSDKRRNVPFYFDSNFFRIQHIVSPLGGTENFGKNAPPN